VRERLHVPTCPCHSSVELLNLPRTKKIAGKLLPEMQVDNPSALAPLCYLGMPKRARLEVSCTQRRGAHLHRVTYDVANVTIVLREGGAFEASAFPKQMRAAALFRSKFRPPQHRSS
jgi:hypothetical protein